MARTANTDSGASPAPAAEQPVMETEGTGEPPAGAPDGDWEMVVYRGGANLRTITEDQWLSVGVREQPTVSWDRNAGLSRDHFTAEAIDVLRRDANFHFE